MSLLRSVMTSSRELSLTSELLALDQSKRGDLYAVLDGARDDGVHLLTRGDEGPWMYLEDGIVEASYQVCAPRAIALEHRPIAATMKLLAAGWGRSWGIFLRTDHEFLTLRRHLRALSNVRLPNGRIAQFRFYDPRVLRGYLPTCTSDELALVFGPIREFVMEGEDPFVAIRYVMEGRRLVIEKVDLGGV
jgi:hypothetical protein